MTKVIDTLTQEDFYGAFQKLLERDNGGIAAGGDYFKGDSSFMSVLSIKVLIRKSLETYLMILVVVISCDADNRKTQKTQKWFIEKLLYSNNRNKIQVNRFKQ